MATTELILVIILSVTLAIFLSLAIVAAVKIIQILNHIKAITAKAESIADKAEAVGEFFEKSAGPMAIGRLITNVAEVVFKRQSGKSKSKGDSDE